MKKVISLLLIMMMMFTFMACNQEANKTEVANNVENTSEATEETTDETTEETEEAVVESHYPITFKDGMDREVTIDSEPMRVVTMAPSMTETLFALGLGEKVVGRTDYCNFPEAALAVESIGSLREPNIEAIIALNPDLILMSTHASEEVMAKLEEANIKVAVLIAQESFDGVYDILTQAGNIFNVKDAADEIINTMKADVQDVSDKMKDVEKKTVYYVVGFGEWGDYTATGDTFIHDMLEMAGGSNIAADGEGWSYNMESIIEKDPQFLICSELNDTKTTLEATEGYKDLTAVKEGRLAEINQDLLSRQGPRLAEGLKAIAKILHPELFQ